MKCDYKRIKSAARRCLINENGDVGMRLLETCSSRTISFLIRVESTPVSENRLVFGFDSHSEKGDDVSEPRPRLVARSGKAVGGAGCSRTGRKCEKKKKRRKSTKKLLKQSRAIRRNHGRSQGESRIVPLAPPRGRCIRDIYRNVNVCRVCFSGSCGNLKSRLCVRGGVKPLPVRSALCV